MLPFTSVIPLDLIFKDPLALISPVVPLMLTDCPLTLKLCFALISTDPTLTVSLLLSRVTSVEPLTLSPIFLLASSEIQPFFASNVMLFLLSLS